MLEDLRHAFPQSYLKNVLKIHFDLLMPNRNYLQDINNVIYKILNPDTNEMASLYIGNLIIIVFANVWLTSYLLYYKILALEQFSGYKYSQANYY